MFVGLDNVSKLIVLRGSILLDEIEYTGEVDCRELTGEHDLKVYGEFDFRPMTQDDYSYLQSKIKAEKDTVIDSLTVEILETEYKYITGEEL